MLKKWTLLFLALAVNLVHADIPTADTVTNFAGMKFKRIPAGTFQMGFEGRALTGQALMVVYGDTLNPSGLYNEHPRHTVTLTHDFYMGMYEVTNAQFRQFRPTHGNDVLWYSGGATTPVNMVRWFGADSFCSWLTANDPDGYTYRLPTEAEWEYCCRAGTDTWYSTGDTLTSAQASICVSWGCTQQLKAVGSYAPNPWGLFDMHGNAAEWCRDWIGPYSPDTCVNPGGLRTGDQKVIRSLYNNSSFIRTAARGSYPPVAYGGYIGFRVVISNLTEDSLNSSPTAPKEPYQDNVSLTRPLPATQLSGEVYTNEEGMTFHRVRMTRRHYHTQLDSVVYVLTNPLTGDSAQSRVMAGRFALGLSEKYGIQYRLSNRYELENAGISAQEGEYYLTVLPHQKYETGGDHPDVSCYRFVKLPVVPTTPGIGGPLYYRVNHHPMLSECPNGDVLMNWFCGVSEQGPEENSAVSRLRWGDTAWDANTSLLVDCAGWFDVSYAWQNGKGRLFQHTNVFHRCSDDNGVNWSAWEISLGISVGMWYDRFWIGEDTIIAPPDDKGFIPVSYDNGDTWERITGTGTFTADNRTVSVTDSGLLRMYCRGHAVNNDSGVATMGLAVKPLSNLGDTWNWLSTPLLPPGIGSYSRHIKLQSGRYLMFNSGPNSTYPIIIAESVDQGRTWFCRRRLPSAQMSQPLATLQTMDGLIHVAGAYGSGSGHGDNKHVVFSEQWLREGTLLPVSEWGINTTGTVSDGSVTEPAYFDSLLFVVSEKTIHLDSGLRLSVSPNPFNPSTVIRYSLPTGLTGELSIMNVQGEVVFSTTLESASGQVRWGGKGFSSGLYVLRLHCKASAIEKTLKILLVK